METVVAVTIFFLSSPTAFRLPNDKCILQPSLELDSILESSLLSKTKS